MIKITVNARVCFKSTQMTAAAECTHVWHLQFFIHMFNVCFGFPLCDDTICRTTSDNRLASKLFGRIVVHTVYN